MTFSLEKNILYSNLSLFIIIIIISGQIRETGTQILAISFFFLTLIKIIFIMHWYGRCKEDTSFSTVIAVGDVNIN